MKIIQGNLRGLENIINHGSLFTMPDKITHVLSICYTYGDSTPDVITPGIQQHKLFIDDEVRNPEYASEGLTAEVTQKLTTFINNVFLKSPPGSTWYVHCYMGVSRSPAITAGLFRATLPSLSDPVEALREMLASSMYVSNNSCSIEPNQHLLSIFDKLYPPADGMLGLLPRWKACAPAVNKLLFNMEDLLDLL